MRSNARARAHVSRREAKQCRRPSPYIIHRTKTESWVRREGNKLSPVSAGAPVKRDKPRCAVRSSNERVAVPRRGETKRASRNEKRRSLFFHRTRGSMYRSVQDRGGGRRAEGRENVRQRDVIIVPFRSDIPSRAIVIQISLASSKIKTKSEASRRGGRLRLHGPSNLARRIREMNRGNI